MPIVRPARADDADAVLILARAFATSFAVDEPAFRSAFSDLIDAPDVLMAVAERKGEIIGYVLGFDHATLYSNGRVAWVEEITVADGARRQGVGRSLMAAFEAWAAQRKARLVALATRRAAAFYQALGYEESAAYFRKLL